MFVAGSLVDAWEGRSTAPVYADAPDWPKRRASIASRETPAGCGLRAFEITVRQGLVPVALDGGASDGILKVATAEEKRVVVGLASTTPFVGNPVAKKFQSLLESPPQGYFWGTHFTRDPNAPVLPPFIVSNKKIKSQQPTLPPEQSATAFYTSTARPVVTDNRHSDLEYVWIASLLVMLQGEPVKAEKPFSRVQPPNTTPSVSSSENSDLESKESSTPELPRATLRWVPLTENLCKLARAGILKVEELTGSDELYVGITGRARAVPWGGKKRRARRSSSRARTPGPAGRAKRAGPRRQHASAAHPERRVWAARLSWAIT